jgi:hypothetical protein
MRGLRLAALATFAAIAGTLAGCSASDSDQVKAKVEQFLHATATHDYHTLCDQVLAPGLLARLAAGGIGCEQAMAIALGNVRAPVLSIGRITVSGSAAQAITLSGAADQAGAFETIELVRTGQGWRVSALATPSLRRAGR